MSSIGKLPSFSCTAKTPATEPGTPTAIAPNVLFPGITLPSSSKYMFFVASNGAFSLKSNPPISPLFFLYTIKPPPPILPA